MVKTITTIIVTLSILIGGAIYEKHFIDKEFEQLHSVIQVVYEKINDKTAVEEDIYALQSNWLEKKKYLHIFIPHTEIKEIDLWTAETIKLVREKKWEDALSKIEVLKELTEQIPTTFTITLENVF